MINECLSYPDNRNSFGEIASMESKFLKWTASQLINKHYLFSYMYINNFAIKTSPRLAFR
jgi:hypothetical protein